jgi:hypothetical protein
MKRLLLAVALFLVAGASLAQTLTFTAQTTTGAGSLVPVLTWSTTPAATSCTASGDPSWTGTKASSGTQTLAEITSSKTYMLSCTWPGDTQARLTWVAPTQNTDGSALAKCSSQTVTDQPCLKSYLVSRGASATALTDSRSVDNKDALGYTWTGLAAGTHFFGVRAVTAQGVQSDVSNVVSKSISTTQTVNRNVAITVNPKPNAPTDLTVE